MYKMIVAEDELLVRIGIRSMVDWELLGMEIVAEVTNGQSAWEQYCELRPDIVLTDIRMPLMDGIGLIEKIRQMDGAVPIIVLSCLDDFHTVQSTLKLGITDYIHKLTMTREEMNNALLKAKKQLDGNHRPSVPRIMPVEEVFSQYINGTINYKQFVKNLNNRPPEPPLCAVLLALDNYDALKSKSRDDSGAQIERNVMNIFRQALDLRKLGLWCAMGGGKFFFTVNESSINGITDRLRSLLDMYLETTATLYFSPDLLDPADLPAAYKRLLQINETGELLKKSRLKGLNDMSPELSREICLIRDYIWINYAQMLNTQSITEVIQYSPNYLSSMFKKSIGMGLADYIQYVRLEMSKRLLRDTAYSIMEISEQTGFHFESYFTKCFKTYTGITPSEYRKK